MTRGMWKRLGKRYRTSDTIARWIALTILAAMLTALTLNALFNQLAGVWARPSLLEIGLMEQLASITRIIDAAPPAQRPLIASAASDRTYTAQWLTSHGEAGMPILEDANFKIGSERLRQHLPNPQTRVEAYQPSDWPALHTDKRYALLIELQDGSWVMFSAPTRQWGLDELPRNLIVIALVMLSTLLVALVATRYLATPLERFAQGVHRFGSDFKAPPVEVAGPREIRQAIVAFNAMQAQLQHFINDRTQMLAAISHDLRTPLTRMRLRGEFIEDTEQQARLFRDVDEMQAMVNSALDFFRDETRLEPAITFDLAALLQTVVDDYQDAGVKVTLHGPDHLVYQGRPSSIRRMLANLLDNAIKYACEPAIHLQAKAQAIEIRVLDRGPGIAEELQEAVFKPFFRLEGSRNKNTGGVGLGLAAARATVLEHGGRLSLHNRRQGGLEARIVLPVA